jgi:predicted lactoylglutathione lyase
MDVGMDLGAFSVSLDVADLEASRRFYEALGFTQFHGDASQLDRDTSRCYC